MSYALPLFLIAMESAHCLLLLLALLPVANSNQVVDLTRQFSSSANSTCTVPSCNTENQPSAVLDGDIQTWWQSNTQDDPVLLSLTANQVCFVLTAKQQHSFHFLHLSPSSSPAAAVASTVAVVATVAAAADAAADSCTLLLLLSSCFSFFSSFFLPSLFSLFIPLLSFLSPSIDLSISLFRLSLCLQFFHSSFSFFFSLHSSFSTFPLLQDISAFNVTTVLVTFRSPLPDTLSVYYDDLMYLGDCTISNISSSLCNIIEVTDMMCSH